MDLATSDRASCPQCRAVFRGGFLRCPRDGAMLSSAEVDPLVGTVLAERYQIEGLLGEGGIGRVYRARHVRMSRRYAIKVPFGELNYDPKVRARFANEAEAASRLNHPNVIGVVDVGETPEGLLYLAMDLAEGESLAETIGRVGPMPKDRVRRIMIQIAEGLAHAHERGLIHRDLKPENIILETAELGDRARIVDFGIALVADLSGNSGRMTTEGIVLGTPHYMAPEQATDQKIDHRTDLFSLGLMLYEMLAGVLPFEGTPLDVARKNLATPAPPISERVRGLVVDQLLERLAFQLIEKRPEDRPQSAAEVAELLKLIEGDRLTARVRLRMGELVEVDELGLAPVAAESGLAPVSRRPGTPQPGPVGPPVSSAPPPVATTVQPLHDTEQSLVTDRLTPSRRGPIIIAVAILVALIGVLVILSGGDDHKPEAAVLSPDARRVAVIPPDAAVAEVAPADAAVEEPIVDGGTVKRPDAGRPRPKPDAGTTKPRPDAGTPKPEPDAGPVTPPSEKTLTALYNDVGRAINDLVNEKGSATAAAFKKRYLGIPYLEAIRKPELRSDAMSQLRKLQKDLAAQQ